jgi:hypothetical protein
MEPTKFGINYSINLNNDEFRETVAKIIETYPIDEIIETGTYNGLGSTKVFAETNKYVFTVECNLNNFLTATNNLKNYENVCVLHAMSLNREYLLNFLLNEEFNIDTTYDSKFPKSFYMREISQPVAIENALEILIKNDRKQLVFLDSAGGVGYAEFLVFMTYPLQNKILMLDDIDHIKHKRSVSYLQLNGYKVHISSNNRFAWTDFSKI